MEADAVRECVKLADLYKRMGYQPLPSEWREGGRKKPLCKFKEYWSSPAPSDLFDRFPTTNVQVMTGRHWGLCVVDLDGPEAIAFAAENWPKPPRTWVVESGGGGVHWWFSTPPWMPERRKCFLWKGEGKHQGIEFLCDGSLATAPPSLHLKTGKQYRFVRPNTPYEVPRPAYAPAWLLRLPPVKEERPEPAERPALPPLPKRIGPMRFRASCRDVLDAVHDKVAVARDLWGLRFAGGGESDRWVSVHDFDREDRNPSARFHLDTGGFWRPGQRVIPFLQLGVEMGHYPDWRAACDDLAERFNVSPRLTPLRHAIR